MGQPVAGTPQQARTAGVAGTPSATQQQQAAAAAAARPPVPSANAAEMKILSKQKLSELAKLIDGDDRLDEEAARVMMLLADEFVDSVTQFACRLAKHRKSQIVEVKDVQMHLERNWGIRIASGGNDDFLPAGRGRKRPLESHKQRLAIVKRFKR